MDIACTKCANEAGIYDQHNYFGNKRVDRSGDANYEKTHCPSCGSTNVFVHKKGYSAGKGCLGFILLLPFTIFALIGVLFGATGANKIKKTCMNCNKNF